MPSPKSSPAELSNRMNQRLETLTRAAVTALEHEARLPCGLLDLVARCMINEVHGWPPTPLGRG